MRGLKSAWRLGRCLLFLALFAPLIPLAVLAAVLETTGREGERLLSAAEWRLRAWLLV